MRLKSGDKIGKWILIKKIGSGGNGVVWSCKDKSQSLKAIKILAKKSKKSYARFKDEVETLNNNSDIKGLINIIDSNFSCLENNTNLAYYVMPLAQEAEPKLLQASLLEKIDSLIQICKTFEKLHNRGISHRDIKPRNILFLDGKYVVADLGLVNYPDKKDVSNTNESIGAKWTIAPEMKRESSISDGIKADIYSLAKTIWIFLTKNKKGFDGQYQTNTVLEISRFYPEIYSRALDEILNSCTDNDPNARPDISEIINALRWWKQLNFDPKTKYINQWSDIQHEIFPCGIPVRATWIRVDSIVRILNAISRYSSANHVFYPTGGGMDLKGAKRAKEYECIELDCTRIQLIKPEYLLFESIDAEPRHNYFWLKCKILQPTKFNINGYDNTKHQISDYREAISQLTDGNYIPPIDSDSFPSDLNLNGSKENIKCITRWFKGSFLIVRKDSFYYNDFHTYKGLHNSISPNSFKKNMIGSFNREEVLKRILVDKSFENL